MRTQINAPVSLKMTATFSCLESSTGHQRTVTTRAHPTICVDELRPVKGQVLRVAADTEPDTKQIVASAQAYLG
jgi:hypothetical protein